MKKYFSYFLMLFIIGLPIAAVAQNTPPTISGLLDQYLFVNNTIDNAIDLWAYTSDNEDPDVALTFSILSNTDPGSGVSIDSSRYIDIYPVTDWIGYSDVSIQVDDTGGLTDTDTFRVTVSPIPEPTTMLLLGSGILGLAAVGRKKLKRH
jgi:hypothetical protein